MDEEFLTTTPVARILNCSGHAVHIYRNQGRLLPSIRTASGICLYRRSDVVAFAQELKRARERRRRKSHRRESSRTESAPLVTSPEISR